jgi:hypothetical protein
MPSSQAKFQYLFHQFASHFFQLNSNLIIELNLVEVKLNWIEFDSIEFRFSSMYLISI